jgi:hypothetical protein
VDGREELERQAPLAGFATGCVPLRRRHASRGGNIMMRAPPGSEQRSFLQLKSAQSAKSAVKVFQLLEPT